MSELNYVTYAGNSDADRTIRERSVLMIDNQVASQVLTMEEALAAVEESYLEYGRGRATASRATHSVPRSSGWYAWDPMAAAIPKMGAMAIRMKSDVLPPVAGQVKKYCVAPGKFCGLILLFSTEDGAPLAILNDGHIQHARVGAVGGISVKHSARSDATKLGLFGTGGMATAHLWAISKVRQLQQVKVYSPNPDHRRAFANHAAEQLGIEVVAVATPRDAALGVDIIAACTNSLEPVVRGEWLEPGMHVLSVLPDELDDEVFRRCDRYSYSRTSTTEYYVADPERRPDGGYEPIDTEWLRREESLLAGKEKTFLSDILLGKSPGRTSADEITGFVTQGIAIQITAVAQTVYQRAKERGLGRKLPLEWFLQDISN